MEVGKLVCWTGLEYLINWWLVLRNNVQYKELLLIQLDYIIFPGPLEKSFKM